MTDRPEPQEPDAFGEPDHEHEHEAKSGFGDEDGEPDLDSEVAEAVARPGHPAAYASNWRQVLAVDALMGVVILVAGVVVMFVWSVLIGAGIGALGAAYTYAVYRRYRIWKATREAGGLPT